MCVPLVAANVSSRSKTTTSCHIRVDVIPLGEPGASCHAALPVSAFIPLSKDDVSCQSSCHRPFAGQDQCELPPAAVGVLSLINVTMSCRPRCQRPFAGLVRVSRLRSGQPELGQRPRRWGAAPHAKASCRETSSHSPDSIRLQLTVDTTICTSSSSALPGASVLGRSARSMGLLYHSAASKGASSAFGVAPSVTSDGDTQIFHRSCPFNAFGAHYRHLIASIATPFGGSVARINSESPFRRRKSQGLESINPKSRPGDRRTRGLRFITPEGPPRAERPGVQTINPKGRPGGRRAKGSSPSILNFRLGDRRARGSIPSTRMGALRRPTSQGLNPIN